MERMSHKVIRRTIILMTQFTPTIWGKESINRGHDAPSSFHPFDRICCSCRVRPCSCATTSTLNGASRFANIEPHRHHQPRKRSEEHTSELQSRGHLVCRLLL